MSYGFSLHSSNPFGIVDGRCARGARIKALRWPNVEPFSLPSYVSLGCTHVLNDGWAGSKDSSSRGGKRGASTCRLEAAFKEEDSVNYHQEPADNPVDKL